MLIIGFVYRQNKIILFLDLLINYNLLIKTRLRNKRTNLGNIYLEKRYIKSTIYMNVKVTSFIKKKGTNWGIVYLYFIVWCFITYYCYISTSLYIYINFKGSNYNAIIKIIF